MASEEKRSGRNSLNKQRIINPITSTLAADDAVRLSRKTIGKMVKQYRAKSRRQHPHITPDKRRTACRNRPNDGQKNRSPFIPIRPRKSKMKMVKNPIISAKDADEHLQPVRAA
ncbi:hypothetical protein [Dickeya solani]|uniref:hypothetical protein n=1 Tax=Dickeya solani TaxID=1089444 RepID=UPI0003A5CB46|nr:hypothetical protein [Dickeya solani]ANE74917.1 hypothetical protein A4U42_05995 [Dickeya solani IPO 2222]AUC42253.1 hypothetical protein D083_1904 [Dickeya solani RNS 08.23.3.1.A]AUH09667.1 hypothetical protein BJD21_15040 [Dickeya solani D s0432-1]AUH13630.1 hypothetical protein BJJ98_15010 [Dickeya solani]MBJ2332143.1 hypothetical protein [Dickeya solani]